VNEWALVLASKRSQERAPILQRVVAQLGERGVRVAGFFQEPIIAEGVRVGHRVRRLGSDASAVVARRGTESRAPNEEGFCGVVFDNDAFATAREWLREDAPQAQALLIHEVGKFEVAGKGHHDAVVAALRTKAVTVLAVRGDQLFYAVERFGLGEPVATLDLADDGAEVPFVGAITRACSSGGLPLAPGAAPQAVRAGQRRP
jgi:nucleoside-triphosphatase THEP1